MATVTTSTETFNIEEFVLERSPTGSAKKFDYKSIYDVMLAKLKSYYTEENYSGKCTNFYTMRGSGYEKAYYGNYGSMSGTLYKITFNNNLSLFSVVSNVKASYNSKINSKFHQVKILGENGLYEPIVDLTTITVSVKFTNSNDDLTYSLKTTEYKDLTLSRGVLQDDNSKIDAYFIYYDNKFLLPTTEWGYDNVHKNADGSYINNFCVRKIYNDNCMKYHKYMKDTLDDSYKIDVVWQDSLPLTEQVNSSRPNTPLFQEWDRSPMPVVYSPNEYEDITSKIIGTVIDGGEWSDHVIERPIDTKTNWKLYIDGTKLPNYKILWENKDIEALKKTENARIMIQYAEVDPEYPAELRVPELIHETNFAEYNDGNYKTNFKTLYEGAWGEVYDESIMSTLPKQSVWLLLQLDYYGNGITTVLPTQSSTKMAVLLNPSGKSLYSYSDVWNTKGETDGSTIKIITDKGSGEGDDGYKDDTDKGEEDITDGASNSVGVLTTTYAMTIERLNQLGGFLWGANIFDEFSLVNSNPIENIISCKNIPISLSGTDEIIHLGNVDTGTNGAKVASNFSTLNVGQIALPTKYNSFLDFAPYTKVTIYLPYIGFKEIDATIAIGKTLKVAYVADVITGGCIAQIFINGIRFYEFSGEMGVDIPITASNRAQVEASYISNAVGMGASLASGNITGAVDSVLASATAKYNYSSTDTPNANCVASVNRTCYVIIERPTYQELSQFNHTKGKMCNLSKTIGSLKGFTICDANIDLKGITATEQEKQEISNILSSGFFA